MCGSQSVEKPGCALSGSRVLGVYNAKTAKTSKESAPFHFQLASFFRFMAANLSFTQFVTWAKPLYCV